MKESRSKSVRTIIVRRESLTRKGEMGILLFSTLLVVMLLVMALFFRTISDKSVSEKEGICRNDIALHSKLNDFFKGDIKKEINCEPEIISIDPESDNARRKVADAMKFCWDRWGQGKLRLFDDAKTSEGDDADEGIICDPCAIITFSKRGGTINNFGEYLQETTVPGTSQTYLTYLLPYLQQETDESTLSNMDLNHFLLVPQNIPTDEDQAVIFVYAKGKESMGKVKDFLVKDPYTTVKKVTKATTIGAVSGGAGVGGVILLGFVSGILSGGISWVIVGAGAVIGTVVGGVTGYKIGMNSDYNAPSWFSTVMIVPNDPESLKSIGCEFRGSSSRRVSSVKDV